MTTTSLREGELVLALPDGVEGRQFDGADHRLSHCMKAVDWIIKRQEQLSSSKSKTRHPVRPSAIRMSEKPSGTTNRVA